MDLPTLAQAAATLLAEHDDRLDHQLSRLALLRREHTAARRAIGSLASGSDALQAIGATLSKQLQAIAERVGDAADDVAATRARRKRLARVVELLCDEEGAGRTPTAARVRPVVNRLMGDNPGLTYQETYDLTREALADDGIGATGLGLRVREALGDPSITCDDEGVYRLNSKQDHPRRVRLGAAAMLTDAKDGVPNPEAT